MPAEDMMGLGAATLAFLCCFAQMAADSYPATGLSSCPCIAWDPTDLFPTSIKTINGEKKVMFRSAGREYPYPLTYGSQNCAQHDLGLPPLCSNTDPLERPAWCAERWCYVDKTCGLFFARSQFFPNYSHLYYSYATCNDGASSNSFDKGISAGGSSGCSGILCLLQGYLQSSREQIEKGHQQIGTPSQRCDGSPMCNCNECGAESSWGGKKIDPYDVGVLTRSSSDPTNADTCLARAISYTYRRVAAKEGNKARVGYQYFADQSSGSYVQWPNAQWCPNPDYDPRYRAWYAAGSTGPKDVVIVVDVSGSMGSARRSQLAQQATKAILDTLSWKDFATIVLFNSEVDRVFSTRMVPVTDYTRQVMKNWVDRGAWASGGTSFREALLGTGGRNPGAFKVIKDSVAASATAMCQKIIMLLTDGVADFSEDDFAETRRLSIEYDAVLFTYALGSGAETTKTKKMACENRGIFYKVPDGGNLGRIMSEYYKYFADGQQSCTASYIEYADLITRTALYAGCLPMYDRTNAAGASLLGVSCMDINMLTDIARLKNNESSWRRTSSIMTDVSKKCRPLDLTECHLQKLRLKYSSESVCPSDTFGRTMPSVTASTSCKCIDAACADDETFIDEKGYYCDTWVGDNCNEAQSRWGFTTAGQIQLLAKCPHSCGVCTWSNTCSTSTCKSSPLPTFTRACQTPKVTGTDIEGYVMSCGEVGHTNYVATRTRWSLPSTTSASGYNYYISSAALWSLLLTIAHAW